MTSRVVIIIRWNLYNVSADPLESFWTVQERPMNFSLWKNMLANDDPSNKLPNLAFKPDVFTPDLGLLHIIASVEVSRYDIPNIPKGNLVLLSIKMCSHNDDLSITNLIFVNV